MQEGQGAAVVSVYKAEMGIAHHARGLIRHYLAGPEAMPAACKGACCSGLATDTPTTDSCDTMLQNRCSGETSQPGSFKEIGIL